MNNSVNRVDKKNKDRKKMGKGNGQTMPEPVPDKGSGV